MIQSRALELHLREGVRIIPGQIVRLRVRSHPHIHCLCRPKETVL
jgi:hypothetical protein